MLINIARIYVVIIAATGFLFGQMFTGSYSASSTVVGISGLLVGALGGKHDTHHGLIQRFVILCCMAAVIGIGFEAYHYYKYLDIPGNDFGWFLVLPFLLALSVIAYAAGTQLVSKVSEKV